MPEPTAPASDATEQLAETRSRVIAHLYSLNADELAVMELVAFGLVRGRVQGATAEGTNTYDALVYLAAKVTSSMRGAR